MSSPLQEPQLDDLRFQKLVDEARKRIITYCPEWTDYNLSDPGITLIELFAWMTSMLGYRLNQVPYKNYVRFLKLIGAMPAPPSQATTNVTFYLSTPFPIDRGGGEFDYNIGTKIPGNTEVATRRASIQDDEIIFSTSKHDVPVLPPRLKSARRSAEFSRNHLRPKPGKSEEYEFVRQGLLAFQETPALDDAFYLEFDHNISGYVLRLEMDCFLNVGDEGAGISSTDPPLLWECGMGDDVGEDELTWKPVVWERDTTRGLNQGGTMVLHVPLGMQTTSPHDLPGYWLRCRLHQQRPEQGMYTAAPLVRNIYPYVTGVSVKATHSAMVERELLGESNGDPGQTFFLSKSPILPLDPEIEYIEIERETPGGQPNEQGLTDYEKWFYVDTFANSTRHDKHFTVDIATGEVSFGPSVRQPDGNAQQHGAVPPLGAKIRISQYRVGGGAKGNVPPNSLRILKQSIGYIVDVTNLDRPSGGTDAQSLDAAIMQAQRNLQTPHRAVTASDYEWLCSHFSEVARVKCKAAGDKDLDLPPGRVMLLVVPPWRPIQVVEDTEETVINPSPEQRADAAIARNLRMLTQLQLSQDLKDRLRKYLEQFRVLGIVLDVREPTYIAVQVKIQVQRDEYSGLEIVEQRVTEALQSFITPLPYHHSLVTDSFSRNGSGPDASNGQESWQWPFGRNMYLSDVYTRIQQINEVSHITHVDLWWTEMPPSQAEYLLTQVGTAQGFSHLINWQKVDQGFLEVPVDGLLYLLSSEVEVVSDEEFARS